VVDKTVDVAKDAGNAIVDTGKSAGNSIGKAAKKLKFW